MGQVMTDEAATGKVKEVFDDIRGHFGMVPNFFRALAVHDADWLELNWYRWKQIMGQEKAMDRKTKELIALAVSTVNDCAYCKAAHEAMARQMGASKEEVTEMREVVELFASFNSIADSLDVPIDVKPEEG